MNPTMEQISDTIIKDLNLTNAQVWEIVREWYINGMIEDVLQTEDGRDLEEVCEQEIQNITIGNSGLQR